MNTNKTLEIPKKSDISKNSKKKHEFSLEEQNLQYFHKEVRKTHRDLSKKKFNLEILSKKSTYYREIIDQKIQNFKPEIDAYFSAHESPVFAYDIEEQDNKIVCFCGIELFADLSYRLYFKVNNNIFHLKNDSASLEKSILELFKHLQANTVIAHGFNQKELKFAEDSHKFLNNTEIFAATAMNSENDHYKLTGRSLAHFESKIGFERAACAFFKHEWIWFSCFNAMEWSFRNYLTGKEQRTCLDCQKEQDVLLYCLEDALVSLFICIWYKNHEQEILPSNELI